MKRWLLLSLLLVTALAGPAYAAISFVEDSTANNSSANTLTANAPVGTAEGDLVIALACINATGGTWTDPADFTPIHTTDSAAFNCYVGYDIEDSTPASTYQFDSSSSAAAITLTLLTWRGVDTSTPFDATFVEGSHFVGYLNNVTSAAQDVITSTDGAVAVLLQHWNGAVSGFTLGPPSGYTSRSEVILSSRVNFAVSKLITTATTENPGVWTTTGTATSQDSANWTLALKPAVAAVPDFDSGPTLDGVTATGATFDYDANADADTIHCMATDTAASVPTAAAIEAHTGSHGDASEATTGSADTITIGFSDTPVFPIYDMHCVVEEGTSNYSSVVTVSDVNPSAPTGRQFVAITSIGAGGAVEDFNTAATPDIAAGDYLLADLTTAPGAYDLTISSAGLFSYDAAGDPSEQSVLDTAVYDASVGNWHADDLDWYNNNPVPTCLEEVEVFVFTEDEVAVDVDLSTLGCEDDDALTYTIETGTPPTGMSISASPLFGGTPTTEDETGAELTFAATDPPGDSDTFDAIAYVINTVTLSNYTEGTLAEAETQHLLDFPWQGAELTLVPVFECSAEAEDEVVSQTPQANTEVTAYQEVEVGISNGVACGAVDLTGLPLTWSSWVNVLADPEFVTIKRGECDAEGIWASWLSGTAVTPRGSANCVVDVDLIRQEADGTASWARWAPGTTSKNSGNLQIDVRAALTADFVPN